MRQRKGKIWEYLNSVGVLEKGTDDEIKAAKRAYRKRYFLEYKQRQRINKPEYTITFSKGNGEHGRIITVAKKHKMSVPAFIHSAVLAYMNQTFVVPDRLQVARLEQLLSECLNEIKTIVREKERFFWQREQKFEAIEKRIERLEFQINDALRNPPLAKHDYQNQIA
jgi:hypothetical protein